MKKIEFTADHVGLKVTHEKYGKGEISEFKTGARLPVRVRFPREPSVYYFHKDGTSPDGGERVLFIGHDVKFKMVEEGELPEPKTLCPVCGVEHEVVRPLYYVSYSFITPGRNPPKKGCPFRGATFETKELAEKAMANLIKFCELPTEEISFGRRPHQYHDRMVEFWNKHHSGEWIGRPAYLSE